jgi:hypothetical protein
MRPLNLHSIFRKSALALAVAGVLGGIAAAPASAEEWYRHDGYGRYDRDDGWRAREWREHAWRAHEWREHRYYRDYYGPRVVYGAPGYYAPGYYYAPPASTFGFTFH